MRRSSMSTAFSGNAAPDCLRLSEWERELKGLLLAGHGWHVACYGELESTMDEARRLARGRESRAEPLIVMARHQTRGRGRRGTAWVPATAAFYATYVFHEDGNDSPLSGLPLVVGVVICQALEVFGAKLGLKWPNDIVTARKEKLGGVLVESFAGTTGREVLVGIGLNLSEAPAGVESSAALSSIVPRQVDPVTVAGVLSDPLWRAWKEFQAQGFAGFRQMWRERAVYLGEEMAFETGIEVVSGRMIDINDQGCLQILDSNGVVRTVVSGHMIEGAV